MNEKLQELDTLETYNMQLLGLEILKKSNEKTLEGAKKFVDELLSCNELYELARYFEEKYQSLIYTESINIDQLLEDLSD